MTKVSDLNIIVTMMESGDIRGLTRAISIVENNEDGKALLLDYVFGKKNENGLILGLTGAPGVGKSTLANCLIKAYRAKGRTVGVLAVDPTSPYSGGAVLGDRIRMSEHNADSGVYIRSVASRNSIGGLSDSTKYILNLYRAFGFDVIVIETLGVGQDEIDVSKYVDVSIVILVPGYGDSIQMTKAGIMEIADLFVINKSDQPGAEITRQQLANAVFSRPDRSSTPIINAVAESNEGISEITQAVEAIACSGSTRKEAKFRQRMEEEIRANVLSRVRAVIDSNIDNYIDCVGRKSLTPYQASESLFRKIKDS